MNATNRTLVFVCVAAVSAAIAMGVRYANRPAMVEGFSDVGQEFFSDFQDPLKATELTVQKFDADAKDPLTFSVKQDDKGLWIIPSHHNYPAEAAERLAKTATSLIGIRKIALQSRSKDDWARYGVEDPTAETTIDATDKGDDKDQTRGTRITLRDNSGNGLVDLIVGKPVEGREKHFYVRQPDKNPVFIAKLDADLSAKFSDWIEPDLLKITQNDIVRVIADRYSIDEEQGAILQGEKLEFSKDKTSSKWTMADIDPLTEQVKESAITDVTRNLDQLKIVGVRPKPAGLNPDLTVTREVAQNPLLRQMLQADMQRQGFYIARGENDQVKLVSNEGELIAGTSSGVKYTLYFGEVARGTAKDLETGLNEAKPAEGETSPEGAEDKAAESPAPDPKAESGPRRYLLVKVEFDESLLGPKPTEPVAPEKPAILSDEQAPADPKPAAPPNEAATPNQEDAPKEDAPKEDAPEGDAPKEEPKAAEPDADAERSDAASEAKPESPADPGSCDETAPANATEAAENQEAAAQADPAAETPENQEKATPATTDAAAADENSPAAPAEEKPAAETPAAETPAVEPPTDAELKAEAQKAYDQALGNYEAAKAGYESALKTWEQQAKDGKKKVSELSTRFGSWYYVISADSFEKFAVSRATVVEPKSESKPETPGLPGSGSIPDFNLPDLSK